MKSKIRSGTFCTRLRGLLEPDLSPNLWAWPLVTRLIHRSLAQMPKNLIRTWWLMEPRQARICCTTTLMVTISMTSVPSSTADSVRTVAPSPTITFVYHQSRPRFRAHLRDSSSTSPKAHSTSLCSVPKLRDNHTSSASQALREERRAMLEVES